MHTNLENSEVPTENAPKWRNWLGKAAVVSAAVSVALLAVPAIASAAPAGGMEHFRIVSQSPSIPGSILARGVFVAGGTDYANNNKDLASFPDGSFTINHPGGTFSFTANPVTCIARITGSGDYTIDHGFGAYRGITGQGSYTFRGLGILPRNPNGSCNMHQEPTVEQVVIRASGPVTL